MITVLQHVLLALDYENTKLGLQCTNCGNQGMVHKETLEMHVRTERLGKMTPLRSYGYVCVKCGDTHPNLFLMSDSEMPAWREGPLDKKPAMNWPHMRYKAT